MPPIKLLTADELKAVTIFVPYSQDGKKSETAIAIPHDELRKKQDDPLYSMAQFRVYNPHTVEQMKEDIRKTQELQAAMIEFINNHESLPGSTSAYKEQQYAVVDAVKDKHSPVARIQPPPVATVVAPPTMTRAVARQERRQQARASKYDIPAQDVVRAQSDPQQSSGGDWSKPRTAPSVPLKTVLPPFTAGVHHCSMPPSSLRNEVKIGNTQSLQSPPSTTSSTVVPWSSLNSTAQLALELTRPPNVQVPSAKAKRPPMTFPKSRAESRTPPYITSIGTYPMDTRPISGELWTIAERINNLPRNINTGLPYRSGLRSPSFNEHFYSSSGTMKPTSTLLQYRDDWFLFNQPMWKFLIGGPGQVGPIAGCYKGEKGWDAEKGNDMLQEKK